jgi:exonuclease III
VINTLRIAAWNANGLSNHTREIALFLSLNKIDILLVSESHATSRTKIKLPNYVIYYANHPGDKAHGGSAILIHNSLKHHELQPYITEKIQSAKIEIHTSKWNITIAALYSPPRHNITTHEYLHYFLTLGPRFVVAGDWNAKNITWGSRLTTHKGRMLLQAIRQENLHTLSTGEPTYWPTDTHKLPDLLDFAVIKQIPLIHCAIKSSFDLHSDHSPIIITVSTEILTKEPIPRLSTNTTNWETFQEYINQRINLAI